jgi:hypothetical protein
MDMDGAAHLTAPMQPNPLWPFDSDRVENGADPFKTFRASWAG